MKIKNLSTLVILLLPYYAIASGQNSIQSRPLKLTSAYEDDNQARIESQSKEIQNLLGRIEILEHTIAQLKERIEIIDPAAGSHGISSTVAATSAMQASVPSVIEDDIFNEPVNKKPAVVPVIEKITKTSKTSTIDEVKDKKLYDTALAALKDNRFEIAEEKFASFIKDYPKSSLQSNAYFWYGEAFFKRNMYDRAAINYLKGYKQYPKGAKAADSLLKLALALGELKKKTESCTMLAKLDAEFPNRPTSSIKRAQDAKVKFGCK